MNNQFEGPREMIGQKRGVKAIDLGLDINTQGYNIFVANFSGKMELDYLSL